MELEWASDALTENRYTGKCLSYFRITIQQVFVLRY